jgi:hypothetical protein
LVYPESPIESGMDIAEGFDPFGCAKGAAT